VASSHHGERILIIEDEDLIRLSLSARLKREGYVIFDAPDAASGLRLAGQDEPDLVLLDYRLPDRDGMSVLRELRSENPNVVVIMMTAHSSVENAVAAMKAGAYTYLAKPFDMEELLLHVRKGLETTALIREVERLRQHRESTDGGPVVIAESPAMKRLLEVIKKVNSAGAPTVLLRGASGVGKDLLARAIHMTSERAEKPFLNITCTALPESLLESELFGHERGAFTDAKQRKEGLLELCDGGTVFLDEIGDMSAAIQAKFLRFLEDRAFRRVGGTRDLSVDVRIVAATNRNLEELVADGRFRQDLFYRISVIPITIPPLRDRCEDIRPLIQLFTERYAREFKRPTRDFEEDAIDCMEAYTWPGNVRELRNVIERAMILGSGPTIGREDLPPEIGEVVQAENSGGAQPHAFVLPEEGVVLEELERQLVEQALERTRGNQTQAARLLGMTRDQIRYRVEKFQLPLGPPAGA
jgi:DNA-binding NtrC family response regulator